jgi:hypothetical protein
MTKTDQEFVTVPVVLNFLQGDVIGELKIRADALPPSPNFVFSIGFKCLSDPKTKPGQIPRESYVGPYQLQCVSLLPDANYIEYLRQVGKV